MDGSGDTSARGLRQVAWLDCPGGGQVVVDRHVAYIAHMRAPHGTTIVDVTAETTAGPKSVIEKEPTTTSSTKSVAAIGVL